MNACLGILQESAPGYQAYAPTLDVEPWVRLWSVTSGYRVSIMCCFVYIDV